MVLEKSSWLAATLTLAGCVGPAPDPAAEAQIAAATGVADAVRFTPGGGAIDAGAPLPEPLPLADAAARALRIDPRLQAGLARVRIALADAHQARLLPNPVLEVALQLHEGGGKPDLAVGLSQEIVALLARPWRAHAADRRVLAASAEALALALDVVAELEETYSDVQMLDAVATLLALRVRIARRLVEAARARVEAGAAPSSELVALEAQRSELEIEAERREVERAQARLRLARLLGEPSREPTFGVDAWSAPPASPEPESTWVAAALATRPELQALRFEASALGGEEALAGWQTLLVAPGAGVEREGDWSSGPTVSLAVPVTDAGAARSERVRAQLAELRHRATLAARAIVEEVRGAYRVLAAARRSLERVCGELLPLQEQRRAQAEALVREEEADVTALLLAERDLHAAHEARLELERLAAAAAARLRRAVGGAAVAGTLAGGERRGGAR